MSPWITSFGKDRAMSGGRGSAWRVRIGMAVGVCGLGGSPALGQSLLTTPPSVPMDVTGEPDPSAPLRRFSMMAIEPPKPRTYQVHDLVTIIIDENSRVSSSQSLETEKDYETSASVEAALDPLKLLELQLRQGNLTSTSLIDAQAQRSFEGDGEYERSDKFTARITAEVIDVKPNGTIVLEARKQIVRDEEITTLVLSGVCRREDISRTNTILSSQLANLSLSQHNEGQIRKAAKKGLIAEVLDAVFAF